MIDPRRPDYGNTPVSNRRPRFEYDLDDAQARPVVSVITPFYNTREIFHETAQSVLRQSLQQWEWLIVNDASTDAGALRILDQYRDRDARIRVIDHPQNKGLAASRNTGFAAATTDRAFLLDDDDLLEPTTLEKLYWHLESYPEYAVSNGRTVGFGAQEYLWDHGFDKADGFLTANWITAQAMIRRDAHRRAGGFDESIRGGMEDWDFWLRVANLGLWGGTIPDYIAWYRRREDHGDRWENLDSGARQAAFAKQLRERFPKLYDKGFPKIERRWHMPYDAIRTHVPSINILTKSRPRVVMILPWMTMGGADKFNLDLTAQLVQRGWEVSILATQPGDNTWAPEFASHTPDIFILDNFLRLTDFPAFARYFINSRRPDVVVVSNSEIGYLLLPYLRGHCPEPAYCDYCHMEEDYWKNGGYPRFAVACQSILDLNVVASQHLKSWMVKRGADPDAIEVVHINIDTDFWKPDAALRAAQRRKHRIADEMLPVLLYAGRICEQKQPRVFARVMNELSQAGVRFRALVAGDGEDFPWLKQYVAEHELQNCVTLLGNVPNDQMKGLLDACDVFFLPSRWEGIALSIYEAMSMGVAVVGAVVGGQRELVTPDCGILLPRADADTEVQQYSEQLGALLRDPERCHAMGANARRRVVEHFQLKHMGARMEELLRQLKDGQRRLPLDSVDPRYLDEAANQAVEFTRLSGVLDQKWSEAGDLLSQYHELDARLAAKSAEADQLWRNYQALDARTAQESAEFADIRRQLTSIHNSAAWRLLQALYRTRVRIMPHGSQRERLGRYCLRQLRKLRGTDGAAR